MYNILFAIILIGIDQGLKYLATAYLSFATPIAVVPNIIGLNYVLNTGMAFSMLSGKVNLLIILTSAALLVMAYFIFIKGIKNKFETLCFILIFSGGVGNLIDRIFAGAVVDYIEFLFIDFPIFNFADILVCCGVALFALHTILTEFNLKKNINVKLSDNTEKKDNT